MKNSITLCIPTLNRYDLLSKCVYSALIGSQIPKKVSIIDNGCSMPDSVHDYLKTICASFDVELTIYTPIHNLGVAKSWNWFLDIEDHPMLICNDDVEFAKEDIERFSTVFNDNQNCEFFYTNNISYLNMFSCFMPTDSLIQKVGEFDTSFYPAYFEDNDYYYRMVLANIKLQTVDTNIVHYGSSTIRQYDSEQIRLHHEQYRNNKRYYIKKWGGEPHKETFTTEFGNIANGNI